VIGLGIGDRLTRDEGRRFGMPTQGLDARLGLLEETIGLIRKSAPEAKVWVGGRHHKVRTVAAKLADGWNAWDASLEEFREEAEEVRAWADRPLTVSWGGTVRLEDKRPPLSELASIADELVVSLVPNRRPSWEFVPSLLS
jgi:hypothetical protein